MRCNKQSVMGDKYWQDGQEALQSNVQKAVNLEEQIQEILDEIARLAKTNEGRRASDAGSVQQGSANTSCCGGGAAVMQTVFEDSRNRSTH